MKTKKWLCGLTCAAVLAVPGAAFADATDINLIVNNAQVQTNEEVGQPYINNSNRTMIPLRIVNDMLGYDTAWNNDGTIRITNKDGDVDVTLKVGSANYTANGVAGKFHTVPTIKNSRTYLPARDFTEIYGSIYWENESRTVWISQTDGVDYQMVGKKLVRSDNKVMQELTVPQGYQILTNTPSDPIVLQRTINDVTYLGIKCSADISKPIPLFRDNGTALEYVTDVYGSSSFYVDGNVVYYTDGTGAGGWEYPIKPNRLTVTTLGENGFTKEVTVGFAINECTLDMKDGQLIAVDKDGVEHVVEGIGR